MRPTMAVAAAVVVVVLSCVCAADDAGAANRTEVYDVYFGKPLAGRRKEFLEAGNGTALPQCTVVVERCKRDEGRRVDGTCNNLQHPSRGSTRSPVLRMLPALFGPNNEIRSSKSGEELPLARLVRTRLFSDGLVSSPPFSQLASHYFVSTTVDLSSIIDLLTYAVVSDCCLGNKPNRVNPRCIPIEVPADDPYLRLTGIRCLNLTRANSYQEAGCIPNSLPRDRINPATPLLDLSIVYGVDAAAEKMIRQYDGGRLKMEERMNRQFPPSTSLLCVNNKPPAEKRCYGYGDQLGGNVLPGTNLYALWFYREHNRIADRLAKVNPCWDDQKLFEQARWVNIAQNYHIYYYELIPAIIGKENALKNGIIYETKGYVNDYDPSLEPSSFLEFVQGTRWFHTFQDGRSSTYTHKGKYTGFRPVVDDLFRSGLLEQNDTIEQLTQGSIRQESAKFDQIFDPDLAERLYGRLQSAADLISIDIMRSRDLGLRTYNDYRVLCGMPRAKKFQDFLDAIDISKVEIMSRLYEDPDDVDIIAGIYSERFIPGGWTGPTLFCIMARQWVYWRRSDRFFYEHGDQTTSFTLPQLYEIRRSTISRVVCDNGDSVKKIQPKAFYRPMLGNPIISCDQIEGIDFRAWRDEKCFKDSEKYSEREYKQNIIFGYGNYAPEHFMIGPNQYGYSERQYDEDDKKKENETTEKGREENEKKNATEIPKNDHGLNEKEGKEKINSSEGERHYNDTDKIKKEKESDKEEEKQKANRTEGEQRNNDADEIKKEEETDNNEDEKVQEMYGFEGYTGYAGYGR